MHQNKIKIIAVIPGKKEENNLPFARRQINSLINAGINVKLFHLTSRLNPAIIFKEFINFLKEIKMFHPQIIHSHYGTMTSFFCAVASLLSGTPLVITFRGSDLNKTSHVDGFWRDFFGRLLSQLSILRASQIMCVSESLKIKMWWGVEKVEIIPCGIDLTLFRLIPKEEGRKQLGWNLEEKIILFNAGKNYKVKRIDTAHATIDIVKRYFPQLRLEILWGNVPHEKMPLYLNSADCLLVTSDSEGDPNIVKEALSCNLPIISFDVGDVAQRLKGVVPSRVVSRDIQKISDAIIEILSLDQRSNGRLTIRELTEERIAQKIVNLYKEIIGDKIWNII